MQKIVTHCRTHFAGYVVVVLGALIQLYLITRPLDFLLINILSDDAFYYFEIAKNVASGIGSTFDGLHATNGYHPLWLLILTPIYSFFTSYGDILTPIKVALFVSVVLNAMTGVMFYYILKRYISIKILHALVLGIWVLNPFLLYEGVNGLETSLALFFLVLFFNLILRYQNNLTGLHLSIIGFTAGFLILARVDMVFYFITFLLWIVCTHGLKSSIKPVLTAGLAASALVVPWLVWNIIGFGMLLTSAAQGSSLVNRTLAHQNGTGALFEIKHIIHHLDYHWINVLNATGIHTLTLIFAGILIGMTVYGIFTLPRKLRDVPVEWVLVVGFSMLFFADAGLRFTGRTWYFISFNLLVVVLCALVLPYVYEKVKYKKIFVGFLTICIAGSFFIGWYKELRARMSNQLAMYEASLWINKNLPENSVIGAFNAGVTGYFVDYPVVNLDGLVNNSALDSMKNRDLWNYMHTEGITHISDGKYYFTNRYSLFLGNDDPLADLEELKVFPIIGEGKISSVSIYQIER